MKCPCGDEVIPGTEVVDISGETLCPSCAVDSQIRCDVCGEAKPVRLLSAEPSDDMTDDPSVATLLGMVGAYMAVCQDCNEGT